MCRVQRHGVAQVGFMQRHRHHRTRIQIDRVLGLVSQVRAPVLHLRNPSIPVRRALPLLIRHAFLALAVDVTITDGSATAMLALLNLGLIFTDATRDVRMMSNLACHQATSL
jgi:hypothetical protein